MVEIRYGAKDIDDFISKLEKYTLDPAFEKYGNFIHKNPKFPKNKELTEKYKGWYCLFGNFLIIRMRFQFTPMMKNWQTG